MNERLVEHVYEHSTNIFCPHRDECTMEANPDHWLRTKIVIHQASITINGNPAEAAERPKTAGGPVTAEEVHNLIFDALSLCEGARLFKMPPSFHRHLADCINAALDAKDVRVPTP